MGIKNKEYIIIAFVLGHSSTLDAEMQTVKLELLKYRRIDQIN